jgi:hypothetical protein
MSGGDLVVSHAGAVVPSPAGAAVGEYVGDVSVDHGAALAPSSTSTPSRAPEKAVSEARLMRSRLGSTLTRLGLTEQQRNQFDIVLLEAARTGVALDEQHKAETQQALLERWGDAYNGNIKIVEQLLNSICGGREGADRLMYSRDSNARVVIGDANLMEALLAYAHKQPKRNEPMENQAAVVETDADKQRVKEIEGWMGARKGSDDYNRYWKDPDVDAELRALYQKRAQTSHNDRQR